MKRLHTQSRKSNIRNRKTLRSNQAINTAKKTKFQMQNSQFKDIKEGILAKLFFGGHAKGVK